MSAMLVLQIVLGTLLVISLLYLIKQAWFWGAAIFVLLSALVVSLVILGVSAYAHGNGIGFWAGSRDIVLAVIAMAILLIALGLVAAYGERRAATKNIDKKTTV